MQSRKSQGRQNHFRKLVSEALNGEYPMEKLPSPAYDFAEERQAVYYSKMRYNMESDMSVMVMKHHQQLTELELMKKWKNCQVRPMILRRSGRRFIIQICDTIWNLT